MRNAPDGLRHALLERLMHYYHFLSDVTEAGLGETVTSGQVAELMHTDDTLVRKDLAAIGVRGLPNVGFKCAEVVSAIRDALGFDHPYRAVLIGVGRLGSAIASYRGFSSYGLEICGLFDKDPVKVGLVGGGLVVLPVQRLALVVAQHHASMAIICVPAEDAQEVADLAVSAGIKAIWNFAATDLVLPDDVFVRHEHISVGLAVLSYHLNQAARGNG
ncbi:MAG: redox-sensing transcriptional repressor Rex [Candidatus Hydrogenedentes bacterium]|nr:redox-sensing transcriptional repressor Rex [Candidatus Hydrogenedentota bacterium]